MEISSARPSFKDDDIENIFIDLRKVLKGGRLTSGPVVKEFEDNFAEYIGVKHAIAVNSCTSALEIVLRYYNVKEREVIVPTNSFVASANAVLFAGGKPILADIMKDTLCLDPTDALERITPKTKCIMVVHLAGLTCPQIEDIQDICKEKGLILIEDAAHAHGSYLNQRKAGSFGDAGCFSFFPTKLMTTGEGGMITTNDDELANYAKSIRSHGVNAQGLYSKQGYNWRMSEINAVLGLHQLKRLEEFVLKRNEIASKYSSLLNDINQVKSISIPSNSRHSYYKYPVILECNKNAAELAIVMKDKYKISTGTLYHPPIHLQPFYRKTFRYKEGMLPSAENILKKEICLPMFVGLTEEEIGYVIESLKKEVI